LKIIFNKGVAIHIATFYCPKLDNFLKLVYTREDQKEGCFYLFLRSNVNEN